MLDSLRRIWTVSVKEFIHLRNDWALPAFMLIGGVLEMMLIGWATARPVSNIPLMILDHDRTQASRMVTTALENTGTFSIVEFAVEEQRLDEAFEKNQITAALIIPPDFSEQVSKPSGQPIISVVLNGAESITATVAMRAVEGVVRQMGTDILLQRMGVDEDALGNFDTSLRVWFNEALSEALYTTPAEMALMLEFTVLLFAALTFSRERELGTLEQLLVMPFSSLEIIIGKAIPVIIVAFLDFLLLLGMIHFIFAVPIRGSLALLLVLAFGYLLVELSKGMVISVISKTQHQAFLSVMVLGFVDFMFTGYAVPVESMPKLMRWVANFIPAHHWLTIARGIMLKGAGLEYLWPNILMLAVLALVIITISLRYIRKALD